MTAMRGSFLPSGNISPATDQSFSLDGCDVITKKCLLWTEFLLEKYCGQYFRTVVSRNGNISLPNNPDGYIVGSILPYAPESITLSEQLAFPLLCVYPVQTSAVRHTMGYQTLVKDYFIVWILPNLTFNSFKSLNPFRQLVSDTILTRFDVDFDEDWNNGLPWGSTPTLKGVDSTEVIGSSVSGFWDYSTDQGSNKVSFPVVIAKIAIEQTPEAILADYPELQSILFSSSLPDGYDSEGQYLQDLTLVEDLTELNDE